MLKYIILGIIQGVTEFLPVSSSAHLIIMQKMMGMNGQEVARSVILHLGTSLALIIFFFKDILELWRNIKWLLLIIIVTVITGIIGISGRDFFEGLFASARAAACALIFTGVILMLTRRFRDAKRDILGITDAFILGITQGIAIIPGISRSGMTISSLLFRGIDPKTSFKFSFLAAIPAIFGAALLEAKDVGFAVKGDPKNFMIGFIFSFITGIFSLWILKSVLNKARLYYFGYYCIFIAIITLLFIR